MKGVLGQGADAASAALLATDALRKQHAGGALRHASVRSTSAPDSSRSVGPSALHPARSPVCALASSKPDPPSPRPAPHPPQVFCLAFAMPDAARGATGAGHGAAVDHAASPSLEMSVPGPPAAAPAGATGDAGAPGAPGGVKAVRVTAKARHALATAFVSMWRERDLETARGVWVTDFAALATRATQASGTTVTEAVAEAWCAKALPKQGKPSTMSAKREGTIAAAWTAAGAPRELFAALSLFWGRFHTSQTYLGVRPLFS